MISRGKIDEDEAGPEKDMDDGEAEWEEYPPELVEDVKMDSAAAEVMEPPPHGAPAVPRSGRVGVTGSDEATTSRGRCLVCMDAGVADPHVRLGKKRFFWRQRPQQPDRSLHPECVLSGAILDTRGCTDQHWLQSAAFLKSAFILPGTTPEWQALLMDAADIFEQRLSGEAGLRQRGLSRGGHGLRQRG